MEEMHLGNASLAHHRTSFMRLVKKYFAAARPLRFLAFTASFNSLQTPPGSPSLDSSRKHLSWYRTVMLEKLRIIADACCKDLSRSNWSVTVISAPTKFISH